MASETEQEQILALQAENARLIALLEAQGIDWRVRPTAPPRKLAGPLPRSLRITTANLIYFEKAQLPPPLANRLVRLAAFQNPEFYRAQAMRLSVWDKPRVIGCAENFPKYIALPRDNDIACELSDERFEGAPLTVRFAGTLRADQAQAATAMLEHDVGVLCAPTAFGKSRSSRSAV